MAKCPGHSTEVLDNLSVFVGFLAQSNVRRQPTFRGKALS
jgi:hypothetical protein